MITYLPHRRKAFQDAGGGGGGAATISHTYNTTQYTNGPTLSSVPIDDATADRYVIACITTRNAAVSSVSIAGNTPDEIASVNSSSANFRSYIFGTTVATGTTCTISFTMERYKWMGISVYVLKGANTTPLDTSELNGAITLTDTLAGASGGVALATGCSDSEGPCFDWSGGDFAEDVDEVTAADLDAYSSASISSTSTSISLSANTGASGAAYASVAAASFQAS
jgi:hypothetical protein